MKVLVLDCTMDRSSWGAPEIRKHLSSFQGLEVEVRRAPEMDLPQTNARHDKIIITGSRASCLEDQPWISGLHQYLANCIQTKKQILGVCFGHQTLLRILGGKEILGKSEQPEYGWTKITQTQNGKLLHGLPETFYSLSSHQEEATAPAPDTVVIASSDSCGIQGFEHKTHPIFGVQFHPEKSLEGALKTLEELKKTGKQKWFSHPKEGPKLFQEAVGQTIFRNFIENA